MSKRFMTSFGRTVFTLSVLQAISTVPFHDWATESGIDDTGVDIF